MESFVFLHQFLEFVTFLYIHWSHSFTLPHPWEGKTHSPILQDGKQRL